MKPASVGEDSMGPDILYDEFEQALSKLENGKATGIVGIPAKILKALGHMGKHELFEMCLDIYRKGHWPTDFMESIIIPIEKKQGAKECVYFRTISLIRHASKMLLKILKCRLQVKADDFLGQINMTSGKDVVHVMQQRH